jgi:pimeloyl-ACP methyl ester carboxylesterase
MCGNFYENRFIDHVASACRGLGVGFAAFNNRGHDYIADVLRANRQGRQERQGVRKRTCARFDYVQIGGAYERVGDCVEDIRAMLDFAEERGYRRILLQGHSLGAVKATHYFAKTGDPRIAGLILLSPADGLGWIRQRLGRKFLKALGYARRLIRQGNGKVLLPSRLYDSPVSARSCVDAFGPKSLVGMFNMSRTHRQRFPELASINVPVLLALGTIEEYFVGPAAEFVDRIAMCLWNCPSFTSVVLKGAPHNYLGCEAKLAGAVSRWLKKSGFAA